jgi:uncharacterized SAM-binding protein YcdF (DUF218 family)
MFFWISKLTWRMLSPDNLLIIMLVAVWVLQWRKAYTAARRLLAVVVIGVVVIALFPVGQWLLYPLERRFPSNPALPGEVDGIVVLGGSEDGSRSAFWNQAEMGDTAERELAFLSLARRYPAARLVFTGGSGYMAQQRYKGAEVARRLLQEQGLDLARVTFEGQSRNTYENVALSKALVQPQPGQRWILVTTAWHMPRSFGIFSKAGWSVIPYPVDHWTDPGRMMLPDPDLAAHLRELVYGVREWIGLAAYYVTGKTSSLLPGPPDHLSS